VLIIEETGHTKATRAGYWTQATYYYAKRQTWSSKLPARKIELLIDNVKAMDIIFLLGRILLGGFFIMSGFNHFKDTEGLAGYAASKEVPQPKWAVLVSGVLLAIGGLGILTGIFPQLAILLLVLFLLPTTFIMHDFWHASDEAKQSEQTDFMKNLALVGALLMLLALTTPWLLAL
jgi:uncharacterized membrane protein YphA (DoxX/SURF4 family)